MTSSIYEQDTIRLYLLGKLAGEPLEEFERRLLTDDQLFEELLATEDELIDDFIVGDLSPDERAQFEKHFLITDERRQKLHFGKAVRKYASKASGPSDESTLAPSPTPIPTPPPSSWQQFFSSSLVRSLAFAAVILIAAFVVWRIGFYQSDLDKGLVALNTALRNRRPVEARLTAIPYAPFSTTRGPGSNNVDEVELRRAELTLLEAKNEKRTPAVQHALGKVYLAQGKFDQAITEFEEALKSDPRNAQIYAELGAALLEKGKIELERAKSERSSLESGKGVEYLARSLENLSQALKLNPNLLEALFNRALVHEAMALLPQAEEDWKEYLRKDPNSQWADEARTKLRLVEEERKKISKSNEEILQEFLTYHESRNDEAAWRLVKTYHNRTGNLVVEQLLDAYLEQVGKNQQEEASRNFQLLSYVGDLEMQRSADRFFFDLTQFYKSTTLEQRAMLVKARDLMKKGHAGWGQLRGSANLELFAQAKDLFERSGNFVESRFAEYWMSFCHFNEHAQEQSRQILDPLLLVCEKKDYVWLMVRGLYLLSAIQFDLNEHSKAVDVALQSVRIAERTNDSVGMLNAAISLIEYYRYVGNYPKSLGQIQQSLALVRSQPLDPIQGARYFAATTLAFATIGFYHAAASYQREALHLAISTGADAAKASNYAFMGMIYGKLKNLTEALENTKVAVGIAQAHSGDPRYRGLEAYAALQMGNIYKDAGEFDKALVHYNQSIELYKSFQDFRTHLYQAHKGRLHCYIGQQDDAQTRAEISIILGLLEKYRSKISDENIRNTFFDVEHSVFDIAIEFEYSRMRNSEQAFNYSNLSRARSLLDLLNTDKDLKAKVQDADIKFEAVSKPIPLERIKQQLSSQAQILQYVVLKDKLLFWVISRNNFQVAEKVITQKELDKKLRRFLTIVSSPSPDNDVEELLLAKDLYAILIQPVESFLDKEKVLSIIPDKTLGYLPFTALVSPASERYLFEERLLMTSPSPSVFLSCSETAASKGGSRDERALSVGNPSFDRAAFPKLDPLPAAGKEAIEVGRRYGSRLALIEDKATTTVVKNEIEKSDVIHLALHSTIDEDVPLRSKLLMARMTDSKQLSESVLYAYEIYNLKLSRTRLVVLSACQTGAERNYGGEGMMSLARAFIGARVPLVVASLWPVDSTATEELMINFHRYRKEKNASTVQALRNAQQDMLRDPTGRFRRPYYWAAFNVSGGYAEF